MRSFAVVAALSLAFSVSAQNQAEAHDGLLPLTTTALVNEAGSTTGSQTIYATAVTTSTLPGGGQTTIYSDINGIVGDATTVPTATSTVGEASPTGNTGPNQSEAHDGLLPLTTTALTNSAGSTTGSQTLYATAVTTSTLPGGGQTTIYSDINGIVGDATTAPSASATVIISSSGTTVVPVSTASGSMTTSTKTGSAAASASASASASAASASASASATAATATGAASSNYAASGLGFFGAVAAALAML